MTHEKLVSQPFFEANISDSDISLGESFRLRNHHKEQWGLWRYSYPINSISRFS